MYEYLIGLNFEEAINELTNRGIEFDFGESSYEDIIELLHECEVDNELSFEETYIYIGGYWNDAHYEVHFNDNFIVDYVDTFEGWE